MRASALQLFGEHGFQAVTVQQIADHAGVTERTFFRHFANKEEVLFSDEDIILTVITQAFDSAPRHLTPRAILDVIATQLGDLFEASRTEQRIRVAIITSEPALLERDLLKQEKWAQAITELFRARGLPVFRATVLSRAATAVFRAAYLSWTTDKARTGFATRVHTALDALASEITPTV